MHHYLDFEKAVADLEGQIFELKKLAAAEDNIDTQEEIARLEKRAQSGLRDVYKKLTPWQKTQVARHPDRPHFLHYARRLFTDVTPLSGDRKFAEDEALQAGFARFRGEPVAFLGLEKGHDTKTRLRYNFGSARPEGYRKAARIMEMADRFKLPVLSLVDTAGAYPGVSAEERGQAEAIARSTAQMLNLQVPVIAVIIGEGGSGGAIAIAAANRVYMLEHAIYSVISPEGAASILWRDAGRAKEAATNMRITAQDLFSMEVIDGIIAEPVGGAHRDAQTIIDETGDVMAKALAELAAKDGAALRQERRAKYLQIGHSL